MTYFESTAKIVRAVDQYDQMSADERALRRKNRFCNALLLAETELYHGSRPTAKPQNARAGWMPLHGSNAKAISTAQIC